MGAGAIVADLIDEREARLRLGEDVLRGDVAFGLVTDNGFDLVGVVRISSEGIVVLREDID